MNALTLLVDTGRVLGGRYELGEVIGRGGTATVHLGLDLQSGRCVAIKMLRSGPAQDPLFRSRLGREARTLAVLNHPAIVSAHDTGCDNSDDSSTDTEQVPFIVMEFVPGRSLRQLLDDRAPTLTEAVHYQVGVLSALDVSHRAGIVHRDIKPANVMITPEGCVKVVDFGIARATVDPAATVTEVQGVFGTPLYLSPEQVLGEPADRRSDLYSAGCLLYELLTGQPPFVGDDPVSVAYQHVYAEPERASVHRQALTPALDRVLLRALAKNRTDRFQTAREFSQALAAAVKGSHETAVAPRGRCA